MFLDECLERRRPLAADRLDIVVRPGQNPALMVGCDLGQMLEEEFIPELLLGRRLGLRSESP